MLPVREGKEENFRLFIGKYHLNGQSVIDSDQNPRNYIRKIPFNTGACSEKLLQAKKRIFNMVVKAESNIVC